MRKLQDRQTAMAFQPMDPKITRNLRQMDEILKTNSDPLRWVAAGLTGDANPHNGRPGMTAEQVLRVAVVKQLYDWSYPVLYERLNDSIALREFAGYEFQPVPKPSTLQENVKKLSPNALLAVHRAVVLHACAEGVESSDRLRTDSMAVETNIHHPTDRSLLEDSVRVITRILARAAKEFPGARLVFRTRTRVTKKRAFAIAYSKKPVEQEALYRELLRYAEEVLGYARAGVTRLAGLSGTAEERQVARIVAAELGRHADLLERILSQTRRRVIEKESVPAAEKVVSIFEEHTDIIEKGGRETVFGHKLCLNLGKRLVLDCLMERGNPADTALYPDALDRHIGFFDAPPTAVATDGGFASAKNAIYAREQGVQEVVFPKRIRGLAEDLFPSAWVRRQWLRFRAGCEGILSALKRGVGLGRCLWRGWESFQSYVWASILAYNLKTLARALLEREKPAAARA